MTIQVTYLQDGEEPKSIESLMKWREFQELIQRGSNLWPDASPAVKEFADMITSGWILQDYQAQAGNKKS